MLYYNIERSNGMVNMILDETVSRSQGVEEKNVTEFHDALLAKQENGLYNMYIPSKEYNEETGEYFNTGKYFHVFSNIDAYHLHQCGDIFAFHQIHSNCWKFLSLENFERALSDPDNTIDFMIPQLPTILYNEESAGFKDKFQYLDEHFAIFSQGNQDFLIKLDSHETALSNPGLQIFSLGKAEMLFGGDDTYFQAVKNGKTTIYQLDKPIITIDGKLEPCITDEYTDYMDVSPYWLKNKDDMFWGIIFISEYLPQHYLMKFETPVAEMKFLKQIIPMNVSRRSEAKEYDVIDFWKITTVENETKTIMFSREHNRAFLVDPKNLLD